MPVYPGALISPYHSSTVTVAAVARRTKSLDATPPASSALEVNYKVGSLRGQLVVAHHGLERPLRDRAQGLGIQIRARRTLDLQGFGFAIFADHAGHNNVHGVCAQVSRCRLSG